MKNKPFQVFGPVVVLSATALLASCSLYDPHFSQLKGRTGGGDSGGWKHDRAVKATAEAKPEITAPVEPLADPSAHLGEPMEISTEPTEEDKASGLADLVPVPSTAPASAAEGAPLGLDPATAPVVTINPADGEAGVPAAPEADPAPATSEASHPADASLALVPAPEILNSQPGPDAAPAPTPAAPLEPGAVAAQPAASSTGTVQPAPADAAPKRADFASWLAKQNAAQAGSSGAAAATANTPNSRPLPPGIKVTPLPGTAAASPAPVQPAPAAAPLTIPPAGETRAVE